MKIARSVDFQPTTGWHQACLGIAGSQVPCNPMVDPRVLPTVQQRTPHLPSHALPRCHSPPKFTPPRLSLAMAGPLPANPDPDDP